MGKGPVLVKAFALVGEHRHIGSSNRRGRVILGGEDVAAGPTHLGAEGHQGFDQNGGLDRHVQGTRNARSLEGLVGAELLAQGHQAGHLGFGDRNLLAAEISQAEIGNHIGVGALQCRSRGGSHHGFLLGVLLAPDWEGVVWKYLRRRRGFGLAIDQSTAM